MIVNIVEILIVDIIEILIIINIIEILIIVDITEIFYYDRHYRDF